MRSALSFIMLLLMGCLLAQAAPPSQPGLPPGLDYLPAFPPAKRLVVTANLDQMPPIPGAQDPGGGQGLWNFTLQSAAGLAALAVAEGRGDTMLWLNLAGNNGYNLWLADVLARTGTQRADQPDPAAVVREFQQAGVIKGYILYRAERNARQPYQDLTSATLGYDESVNVATTAAPLLGGIIVEESAEPYFQSLGLQRLLDARDKTEAWAFEQYKDRCNRGLVSLIDPKVWHCREYAIATRSLTLFGLDAPTDAVFAWLKPHSPVIGWNIGDEYHQTQQVSRHALFHTANNWCLNLPVMSTVRAGEHVPWPELDSNPRAAVDPLALDWAADTHYTSFVMTDGDNMQWLVGGFFANSRDYWASPSRTTVPIGWTMPADSLVQLCVPALRYMTATASPNDQVMLLGGGYYYAEDYGTSRTKGHALLEGKAEQVAATMKHLNLRVLQLNNFDWDGPTAIQGYELMARKIENLTAIFAIQYSPYNAGEGRVLWVTNREGAPIPVISARYALWGHQTQMKDNGPPALIAQRINAAAYQGEAATEGHFDWTTVHVWSYFQKTLGTPQAADPLAEEVDQRLGGTGEVYRGVEPVAWCQARLKPHVKVVSPEELAWRMRLHLRTRETLAALAERLAQRPDMLDFRQAALDEYRAWLETADLNTSAARAKAYARLQRLADGRVLGAGPLIQ